MTDFAKRLVSVESELTDPADLEEVVGTIAKANDMSEPIGEKLLVFIQLRGQSQDSESFDARLIVSTPQEKANLDVHLEPGRSYYRDKTRTPMSERVREALTNRLRAGAREEAAALKNSNLGMIGDCAARFGAEYRPIPHLDTSSRDDVVEQMRSEPGFYQVHRFVGSLKDSSPGVDRPPLQDVKDKKFAEEGSQTGELLKAVFGLTPEREEVVDMEPLPDLNSEWMDIVMVNYENGASISLSPLKHIEGDSYGRATIPTDTTHYLLRVSFPLPEDADFGVVFSPNVPHGDGETVKPSRLVFRQEVLSVLEACAEAAEFAVNSQNPDLDRFVEELARRVPMVDPEERKYQKEKLSHASLEQKQFANCSDFPPL